MNRIIAILGMSGAGKDSVARYLAKKHNYKFVVSTTTRPKRSGESDGVQYYFKTQDEFQKLIDNNELIEYRFYDTIQNGQSARWHYGIERKEIDLKSNSYVVVVDLKGLEDLKLEFGDNVYSIFLDVDYHSRKNRAIARDVNFELEEFERRYEDDLEKFNNVYNVVDLIVDNYSFNWCIEHIVKCINRRDR